MQGSKMVSVERRRRGLLSASVLLMLTVIGCLLVASQFIAFGEAVLPTEAHMAQPAGGSIDDQVERPASDDSSGLDSSGLDVGRSQAFPKSKSGSVVFKYASSSAPCAESEWVFSDEVRQVQVTASVEGVVTVDCGAWSIRPLSPDLHVSVDKVEVTEGRATVVWVINNKALRVRVVDVHGNPVHGALVRSLSGESEVSSHGTSPPTGLAPRARTESAFADMRGEVTLGPVLVPGTRLQVQAAGFCSFSTCLLQTSGTEEIVLAAAGAKAQLSLCDERDGLPIAEGVEVCDGLGPLSVRRVDSGVVDVFLRGPGPELLRVWASGYAVRECRVDSASAAALKVELRPAAAVTVISPRDGVARVTLADAAESGQELLWPMLLTFDAGGSHVLNVAVGSGLHIEALASDGAVCTKDVNVVAETDVQLDYGPDKKPLVIHVTDANGMPVPAAWAAVEYGVGWRVRRLSDSEGDIAVPMAEGAKLISIEASGYVSKMLVPSRSRGVQHEFAMSGRLDVVLEERAPVTLHVVDEAGEALAGLRVQMRLQGGGAAMDTYPDLGGCWPTSHRAWLLDSRSRDSAATDRDGNAHLCVPTGRYLVEVRAPEEIIVSGRRTQSFVRTQMVIEAGGRYGLIASEPQVVRVSVVDAVSLAPIASFSAREQSGRSAATAFVGYRQDIVLASGVDGLSISALGYRAQEVAIDGRRDIEVALWPESGPNCVLEIVGPNAAELIGKKVIVSASVGDSGGATKRVVWREMRDVDDVSRIPLRIEGDFGLQITVQLEAGGMILTPIQPVWTPAGHVVFECRY